MHFVSIEWFAWMAFTISTFWVLPAKWRHQSLIMITLVFLLVYSPISLAILFSLSAISFSIVNQGKKKLSGLHASIAIALNVTILVFYKIYAANQSNDLLTTQIIPLGLAYYTLRLIHYIIEGYKGRLQTHKFIHFIQYIFFLPTMVVGPIHRFAEFHKDIKRHHWDLSMIAQGSERILYGYVKLTFLANYLISGVFSQYIATVGEPNDPLTLYLNMIRASLNLYMQFSGFSDIAIGFAKILGFKVMENFKWPYFQKNISDFWRCWHISLTSWCREYIYNTVFSITRMPMLGALATMVIIGVWHEFSARYVVWGLYHGLGIIILQFFQKHKHHLPKLPEKYTPITNVLSILFTLHFVWLGFNIVRYPTLGEAFTTMKTVLLFWM
jgi:alginate O-acetyltransferase complex protein AlgI